MVQLINRQGGIHLQIKPPAPTQYGRFVLMSWYGLSAKVEQPVRQLRKLRLLVIEIWVNSPKIDWQGVGVMT